jgi:hypothetical protein
LDLPLIRLVIIDFALVSIQAFQLIALYPDTTGAIAGQFAGAHYGYDSIPEYLIEGLARKEMIDEYLNKILYQ